MPRRNTARRTRSKNTEPDACFKALVEAAPGGILVTNADGIIVLVNERLERLFGYTQDELVGSTVELLIPERFRQSHIGYRDSYSAKPSGRLLGLGRDLTGRRKDGTEFPVEIGLNAITSDNGQLTLAFVTDITERKQMELALEQSEARFRLLLEELPIGIAITRNERPLYVNGALLHQFGYQTFGELADTDLLQRIASHDRERILEVLQVSQQPLTIEIPCQRVDESVFPALLRLGVISLADGPAYIAFVTDITERKRLEEERVTAERVQGELDKEKALIELREHFITLVSHDFRTPLTVIQAASQLLSTYFDRLSPERRLKYLHDMQAQIQYMVALLDDVLVLDRAKSGKTVPERAPLDLLTFCRDVLDQVQLTDDVGHPFVFSTEGTLAGVWTDEHLLRRILLNLLSNAIKYSPHGGEIQFHVSVGSDTLLLQVTDHGIGIPAEDQDHLFEAFYRAHNMGTILGTGLGLAIVKSSVDALGGTIRCESHEGQGTTFWVRLPVISHSS